LEKISIVGKLKQIKWNGKEVRVKLIMVKLKKATSFPLAHTPATSHPLDHHQLLAFKTNKNVTRMAGTS